MQHRTRRTAATAGVALTGLIAAPPAHGAFFTAGGVEGAETTPGIVTGPTAGRVAVAGTNFDGVLSAAAHAPGGAFGATTTIASGNEDEPALFGTGGAVTSPSGAAYALRRLRPDGSVSAAVPFGTPGSAAVGTPAIAPGGALLAPLVDGSGDLQLWRQAADGLPALPLLAVLPDDATAVDIEPIGPDTFVVLIASPAVDGLSGTRLRAVTVTGASVSGLRAIDDITDQDSGVSLLRAVPGASPFALYVATAGSTSTLRASALSGPEAPPKDVASVGADESIDDVRGLALPDGGVAVAWTRSDVDANTSAAYAILDAAGNKTCEVAEPLRAVALVDRDGPLLVGVDASFRLVTVPVAAGCPAGTPAVGPVVEGGIEIDAAVDVDGTLIAAVAREDGGPAAVVVDDDTAPQVSAIRAPDEVPPAKAFGVAVTASDPWGVAGHAWSVDGDAIAGTGPSVTVPGQRVGTARVAVSVRNAAGLTASRSVDVRVDEDAPPPPKLPDPPKSTTTTSPSTTGDATAPKVSGVRLVRSLVRPLRATRRTLPRGTAVSFTLSEAARYRVTLLREAIVPGARSRCDVPSGSRGSTRTGRMHEIQGAAPKGTMRVRITGRDRAGRRLPRGRYRVSVRAVDAVGNWSATKYVRLTIC